MPDHDFNLTADQALAGALLLDTLSNGFRYPDAALYAALEDGRFARTLSSSLQALDPDGAWQDPLSKLEQGIAATLARGHTALESDYIALFEANRASAPLHLNAHLYSDDRDSQLALLQRLQAAYQAQGLRLQSGDQADHLCVQLDFMALLLNRLHESLSAGAAQDVITTALEAVRRFRRELDWIPRFGAAMSARPPHDFYSRLAQVLVHQLNSL